MKRCMITLSLLFLLSSMAPAQVDLTPARRALRQDKAIIEDVTDQVLNQQRRVRPGDLAIAPSEEPNEMPPPNRRSSFQTASIKSNKNYSDTKGRLAPFGAAKSPGGNREYHPLPKRTTPTRKRPAKAPPTHRPGPHSIPRPAPKAARARKTTVPRQRDVQLVPAKRLTPSPPGRPRWTGCYVNDRKFGLLFLVFDADQKRGYRLQLLYRRPHGKEVILRNKVLPFEPDIRRLRLAWTVGGYIRLSSGSLKAYFDRQGQRVYPLVRRR